MGRILNKIRNTLHIRLRSFNRKNGCGNGTMADTGEIKSSADLHICFATFHLSSKKSELWKVPWVLPNCLNGLWAIHPAKITNPVVYAKITTVVTRETQLPHFFQIWNFFCQLQHYEPPLPITNALEKDLHLSSRLTLYSPAAIPPKTSNCR